MHTVCEESSASREEAKGGENSGELPISGTAKNRAADLKPKTEGRPVRNRV